MERLRNPVRAARKILSESPHVYFVAEGAERFAAEHGVALCKNEDLIIPREVKRLQELQARGADTQTDLFAPTDSHDTVGAVALDGSGNIAAATSTGGTLNKAPGRLGDSSLIGCGCYADNKTAAASTTGWGEPIMKLVLAKWAADRVAAGNLPEWVAAEAINYLQSRLQGHGGMILLDARGRFGIAHNTPRMAWAVKTTEAGERGNLAIRALCRGDSLRESPPRVFPSVFSVTSVVRLFSANSAAFLSGLCDSKLDCTGESPS